MPYKDPEKRRTANRLASRKHNALHRGKRNATSLAYYHAHREERSLYGKHYRATDKYKEHRRVYERSRPDARRAKCAKRRACKREAPINDLTASQWRDIKVAYGHRCVYCGRKMQRLTMDHVIPLSKGGSHTVQNVVPACMSCNSKKGDRSPLVPVQPLLLC